MKKYSFSTYLPFYRRNLAIALPVVLTQLGGALVGLFDMIMVGHYSTADMAAVSFSNALFFTVMTFGMGALMGITPLVGYVYVRGETDNVRSYWTNGLVFCLIIAAVCSILLFICIPLLPYMGQEQVVIEKALPYFVCCVLSIFPFMLFCLQKQFLEGLGNTIVATVIAVIMNGLNIFLNYILIFGKLGFSPMGATGAGIASLISRCLMPLCFMVVMYRSKQWRFYIQFSRLKEVLSAIKLKEITKIGMPIGGQTLLETVGFTATFVMVGWINKEAIAAHQIANQMADQTFMISLGIGAATTIRVSHQYGLGDIQSLKRAAYASVHLGLFMSFLGMILMIGLRKFIPLMFTTDEAVIPLASKLLVYAGIFQLSDGLQCIGASMLRGLKDVRMPVIFTAIAYLGISLPTGYLCTFTLNIGVEGMWIGFILGLSTVAVLFHWRFHLLVRHLEKRQLAV